LDVSILFQTINLLFQHLNLFFKTPVLFK